MQELSKLYTKPSDQEQQLTHKYSLRGVATTTNTTYVLASTSQKDDLMEVEEEAQQWWKLSFAPNDTRPVGCSVCSIPCVEKGPS